MEPENTTDPSYGKFDNSSDTIIRFQEMLSDLKRNKMLFCHINFIFQEYPPTGTC